MGVTGFISNTLWVVIEIQAKYSIIGKLPIDESGKLKSSGGCGLLMFFCEFLLKSDLHLKRKLKSNSLPFRVTFRLLFTSYPLELDSMIISNGHQNHESF
jgi:hypothetical protein